MSIFARQPASKMLAEAEQVLSPEPEKEDANCQAHNGAEMGSRSKQDVKIVAHFCRSCQRNKAEHEKEQNRCKALLSELAAAREQAAAAQAAAEACKEEEKEGTEEAKEASAEEEEEEEQEERPKKRRKMSAASGLGGVVVDVARLATFSATGYILAGGPVGATIGFTAACAKAIL
mmetsp:Transcript_45257/g.81388  ORF Transcript_45257/g.81388 Transcript_45257/m.81388 type:complete len:176 (-) Transcript_45257:87-614(-)|eukprot:CAMPEP_0197631406 /NCGR_PEP_ID=MMETSP1338-20131121/8577_1 /TAXON_ID=43686 ORGANISM="Pelagodinium beii, Strain RCC1491" /NCGR_SAMPLE_ID=MMETSP1338 /ASSEMBLY_ACC=CAM_ASM_000754 /LENGTH=175 /DNA_ID=CAMNT_0043202839 /DNA_START=66 /DNA_END=593 /DNA_ORIENTATION=+